jgi:hypothetical protein
MTLLAHCYFIKNTCEIYLTSESPCVCNVLCAVLEQEIIHIHTYRTLKFKIKRQDIRNNLIRRNLSFRIGAHHLRTITALPKPTVHRAPATYVSPLVTDTLAQDCQHSVQSFPADVSGCAAVSHGDISDSFHILYSSLISNNLVRRNMLRYINHKQTNTQRTCAAKRTEPTICALSSTFAPF